MRRFPNAQNGKLPFWATGQAVVTLSGRDHYLGPWQSAQSKREYARLTSEWLAAGGVLVQATGDSRTVEEALAAFWRHAKAYYADSDGNLPDAWLQVEPG